MCSEARKSWLDKYRVDAPRGSKREEYMNKKVPGRNRAGEFESDHRRLYRGSTLWSVDNGAKDTHSGNSAMVKA